MALSRRVSPDHELKNALATRILPDSDLLSICGGNGEAMNYAQLQLLQFPLVLQGFAGSGKTTLGWHLGNRWGQGHMYRSIQAVVVIDTKECHNALSLMDILTEFSQKLNLTQNTQSWLYSLIETKRQSVMLIFDGIEYLTRASSQKPLRERFIYKLLTQSLVSKAPCIILGRPGPMERIMEQLTLNTDTRFNSPLEVMGFRSEAALWQYFSRNVAHHVRRSVEECMREQQGLQRLFMNPRIASILVNCLSKDQFFLRERKTSVLHTLLLKFVAHECAGCSTVTATSLFQLPLEADLALRHICHLALICLLHGTRLDRLELSHISLNDGVASLEELGDLGLISHGPSGLRFLSDVPNIAQVPDSNVVVHFLAAMHVEFLSLTEQVDFYFNHAQTTVPNLTLFTGLSMVSLFLFGIGRLKHRGSFESGKLALGSAVECMANAIQTPEGVPERKKLLLLLRCIYEAKEASLIRSFATQFPNLMVVDLTKELSKDEMNAVMFLVSHSGHKDWQICLGDPSNQSSADTLLFFTSATLSEDIKVGIVDGGKFFLHPTPGAVALPRKTGSALSFVKGKTDELERAHLFQHAVQSNAQREAFHRVLNLYSKVRLRSDATDPAYISFITCGCVEEKLHGEIVVEPVHPIHSVKLAAKSKKLKEIETEKDAARRHIEEEHDKYYTEIIILSKPYPKSLTFQPQGSSEVCQLVLSTETLPSTDNGKIAMAVKEYIVSDANMVACVLESEQQKGNTKLVTHGFPLPKSKSKKQAVKDTGEKIDESEEEEDEQERGEGVVKGRSENKTPATAAMPAPASRPYKYAMTEDPALVTPVPAQAETGERTVWRPGMIMFTSLPDVFVKEQIYSLPSEEHLVRRGGNGQIFSVEYSGYNLVAKKTHFRSREFAIMQQVKHANVLPLLALMVGEAAHRRRFYCYHMLPKMSGDIARMLSDHRSLTLSSLKQTNSENPRQFGLAFGNLRYLLAEVLRGLAYLHRLHIIHRDIKASNILVKFHCGHDNLLWCTCGHKYTVCVCDFDAAVELSEENELLPLSKSNPVYYLPPVGTMGFRSPEGSQLVIANEPDTVVPRMSQKSDIWSFGILLLRLFIGEDGPASQRENATLLLCYHQALGMREGGGRMPRVDRNTVEKLLKIPILKSKLSGITNLVDFVSKCLQLNPQDRPTANELLQHRFL